MYQAETQNIEVSVESFYLDDQSSPDESYYVWAYRVQISNNGRKTIQVRNRYWQITDGRGSVQEVHGIGIVGEQPILEPGESFEYTSGTPLSTPSGIMGGKYEVEGPGGELFEVAIPTFSLDSPYEPRQLN